MCIPVDCTIHSLTISLTLVGIIESENCQSFIDKIVKLSVLKSAILVRLSSRLNDMCRRRFSDTKIKKWRDDGGVQDVSCVDECF